MKLLQIEKMSLTSESVKSILSDIDSMRPSSPSRISRTNGSSSLSNLPSTAKAQNVLTSQQGLSPTRSSFSQGLNQGSLSQGLNQGSLSQGALSQGTLSQGALSQGAVSQASSPMSNALNSAASSLGFGTSSVNGGMAPSSMSTMNGGMAPSIPSSSLSPLSQLKSSSALPTVVPYSASSMSSPLRQSSLYQAPSVMKTEQINIMTPRKTAEIKISTDKMTQNFGKSNMEEQLDVVILGRKEGYSSYAELLEDNSIEHHIIKAGYKIHEKVVAQVDGQVEARYLKVSNRDGHIFYIDLDTDGYVASECSVVLTAETDLVHFPEHMKDKCHHEGVGTMLVCKDSMCFRLSDGKNSHEGALVKITQGGDGVAIDSHSPYYLYPIVMFSQVKHDSHRVDCLVKEAVAKFRMAMLEVLEHQRCETKRALEYLTYNYSLLDQAYECAKQIIQSDLCLLNEYHRFYDCNVPCTDCEKEKCNKIVAELASREKVMAKVAKHFGLATMYSQHIMDSAAMFCQHAQAIKKQIQCLGYQIA
jgi:hypothetical protein